jgi:hypothetical protein
MKHLLKFNEKNLIRRFLFRDEKIIEDVIKSLQTKCPPKNITSKGFPLKGVKKFQIEHIFQKFQTITFFTTLLKNKDNFEITNVKLDLYCEDYLLRTNLVIVVFINGKEIECSEKSKEKMYNIIKKYI